jgi:Flp pilus assembly protein CpaB
MTVLMNEPTNSRQGNSFLAGILLGGVVGFAISTLLVGMAGFVWVKKKAADARRGWNLVPVVVASQDIPEGTVITYDQLVQRSVPEQFVTSSVVKPDSASYIVNQRLLVPVQAGDTLLWSQFETRKRTPASADAQVP